MELYVQIHEEDGPTPEIREESKVLAKLGKLEDRLAELEALERETVSNQQTEGLNVSTETERKLKRMVSNLPDSTTIIESMLEAVIEDEGLSSYKTLRKYKRLMKRRGHVLPHPAPAEEDTKFVTSPKTFAVICEENADISVPRVDYLVGEHEDTLGEGWYVDALPEGMVTSGRSLKYAEAVDGGEDELEARRRELTAQDGADRTFQ